MNKKTLWALAVIAALLNQLGCEDSSLPAEGSQTNDPIPISVSITGLEMFDSLIGEVAIEVDVQSEVASVELLADGQVVATSDASPFTITWDTTTHESKVVELVARAIDADENEANSDGILAVVLNDGVELEMFEGNDYELTISLDWAFNPDDEGEGRDYSAHFAPPKEFSRVIAVTWWEDEKLDWEMELAIGSGSCPHGGEKFEATAEKEGHAVLDTSAHTFTSGDEHFAHIRIINAADRLGQTVKGHIKVFGF